MIRLLTLLMLVSAPAAAAVYKWTDENGHVQYSDNPHTQATIVDIATEAASAEPDGAMGIDQQLLKFRSMEQEERQERKQANVMRKQVQAKRHSDERRVQRCNREKAKLEHHKEELRRGCLIKKCEWHEQRIRYYESQIKLDCQ